MGHALIGLAVAVLAAAEATPRPPVLRLPDGVRPVRQAVELTVDPNLETFSGSVAIELEIRESTSLLWLNAIGLKVTSASLGSAGAMRPATVVAGGDDFIGFSTATPLAPGPARLDVSFEGGVSRRDKEGVFAVKEADAWYLFTQFEALAARRAFPCFDEPGYKIPWQVTLRVPHGLLALSNSPASSTTQDGDRDVVRFSPTPPLPSYLVAFAVGTLRPGGRRSFGPQGHAHPARRAPRPRRRHRVGTRVDAAHPRAARGLLRSALSLRQARPGRDSRRGLRDGAPRPRDLRHRSDGAAPRRGDARRAGAAG